MAITRPVTKTIISTTDFGIPVADQINALQTAVAALQPTPWANLTLVNGFTHESGNVPAQYRKVNNCVELRSSVSGIQPAGILMTTLPVGFRPDPSVAIQRIVAFCYSGSLPGTVPVRADITSSGGIAFYDIPASAMFITLTGVRIPLTVL